MKTEIVYYESIKDNNTEQTFELVREKIIQTGIKKIVLASTTGRTALFAMNYFSDMAIELIVIPHQYGFSSSTNNFDKDIEMQLLDAGHKVHYGTMLFHSDKLYHSTVPTAIADFLRIFGEGTKVCVEIVLMAADGGTIHSGDSVIAIAGTGKNVDTALMMQAATTRNPRDLRVNEILCKPRLAYK